MPTTPKLVEPTTPVGATVIAAIDATLNPATVVVLRPDGAMAAIALVFATPVIVVVAKPAGVMTTVAEIVVVPIVVVEANPVGVSETAPTDATETPTIVRLDNPTGLKFVVALT